MKAEVLAVMAHR